MNIFNRQKKQGKKEFYSNENVLSLEDKGVIRGGNVGETDNTIIGGSDDGGWM